MLFFAQLDAASPNAIKDWLIVLGGVMGIALLAKQLFMRSPSIEAEFATKKDVRETDRKIVELRADVDEKFESLQIERQRNLGELHEKINDVAADVAFIRGRMEGKRHDN